MADDQPTAPANQELAARIVAAYVRRNQVAFDQIPVLISTVHQAVAGLGNPSLKMPVAGYPLSRFANLFGPIILCASTADGALKCCGVISQTPTG